MLHVLDNDVDPNGKTLSIIGVSGVKGDIEVRISPDGQTLQYSQPDKASRTAFSYTIDNQHGTTTGTVTVAPADKDHAPHLRNDYREPTFSVAAGGNVTVPVLSDWRDDDGDPIIVKAASAGDDEVSVASDGQLEYSAATSNKNVAKAISYTVTDALSPAVSGKVRIQVLGSDETTGIAPVAQADVVRGEKGKPFTVLPLLNDIPGVDPSTSDATLSLAERVSGWKGATISTDQESGRVTINSKEKGTHYLTYTAGFGGAPTDTGMIRVDVFDDLPDEPVAMPDEAVIRGQQSITVDVLANDFDPAGGMLTVQTAGAANEDMLQVGVIRGRWLRIDPIPEEVDPNPQTVTYKVTNGVTTASGRVTISQENAVQDRPITRPDEATVRAGDSALISVLSNDLTLGGATLTLATNVKGTPAAGELEVVDLTKDADKSQGDVGHAYVMGNQIRYVAPQKTDTGIEVTAYYYARAGKASSRGTITITVKPEPTATEPDSPPEPHSIEARAVSGDTITIPIPASGQDPDGDSVVLVGLDSGPRLGQVLSITPKGIGYRPFPTADSTGTDSFTYRVTDRYGQIGTGTVRVAVVPPGQTQVPMPIDDEVTAKPGASVKIDAMGNDLVASSDKVTLTLPELRSGVALAGDQGPVTATAPVKDADPITLTYELSGNAGQSPTGTITIDSQEGYVNPPRIRDQVAATTDGKTASVDVLADAWDPDGPSSDLTVAKVSDPAATIQGGVVSIPVGPQPQVLSYVVEDGDQATSAALVYVPAVGDGLPYAKGTIRVDSGASLDVALADFIASPRGNAIRLTDGQNASAAPADKLKVRVDGGMTSLKLTAGDYIGPAVVNVEVTDKESLNDPDRRTAWVSIPVQVGPSTPVLRCPEDPQTVTIGTTSKAMDLASLCHVWTETEEQLPALTFEAGWDGPALTGVTPAVAGQSLTLEANANDASPEFQWQGQAERSGDEGFGNPQRPREERAEAALRPADRGSAARNLPERHCRAELRVQVGHKDTIISIRGSRVGPPRRSRTATSGW